MRAQHPRGAGARPAARLHRLERHQGSSAGLRPRGKAGDPGDPDRRALLRRRG